MPVTGLPIAAPRVAGPQYRAVALCLFLAALLPFMAIMTWDPSLSDDRLRSICSFGIPIIFGEIAVIVVAIGDGWSVQEHLRRIASVERALLACLAAIAIGTAVGVAPDRSGAIVRTSATITHVVFGFAVAHLLGRWGLHRGNMLWAAMAAGFAGYAALAPLYVAAIPDRSTFDWVRFGLGVTHVRHAGYYAALGGAAALGLAATQRRTAGWIGWTLVAAIAVALAAWTGSRGALAAIWIGVAVAAVLVPSLRTLRAAGTVIAANVIGVCAVLPLTPPSPAYGLWRMSSAMGADDVSNGRLTLWRGALRGLADHPLFGHGEGQFRILVAEGSGLYNHPHNLILQIAFQWGLIGLACILVLAVLAARRALPTIRRDPDAATPALLVLCTFLVFSLYDGVGFYAYPLAVFALALASLLGDAHGSAVAGGSSIITPELPLPEATPR